MFLLSLLKCCFCPLPNKHTCICCLRCPTSFNTPEYPLCYYLIIRASQRPQLPAPPPLLTNRVAFLATNVVASLPVRPYVPPPVRATVSLSLLFFTSSGYLNSDWALTFRKNTPTRSHLLVFFVSFSGTFDCVTTGCCLHGMG